LIKIINNKRLKTTECKYETFAKCNCPHLAGVCKQCHWADLWEIAGHEIGFLESNAKNSILTK